MSAIEYRVAHKLLFGTDYPFFSARQTIDGLRSVTGTAFGPQMPVIDEQVVEDIIHRPTLELLEIATWAERAPRPAPHDLDCAGDLAVADQAVSDEADATRVALHPQDAALGQQPEELVREELGATDVEEHDVGLDLGRLDLDTGDLLEQRRELARPPVVVGEAVDERVECDERRGGRDTCLVDARPAEPTQRRCARARSLACGPRGSSPSARRGPCSG